MKKLHSFKHNMAYHSDNSDSSKGYGHGKGYDYGHGSDYDDLSDDQYKVMKFALGNHTSDDGTRYFIGLVVIAIAITLLFVLMNIPSFDRVMARWVPDYNRRLATKAFVFLFLVIIILYISSVWTHDEQNNGGNDDDCNDDYYD